MDFSQLIFKINLVLHFCSTITVGWPSFFGCFVKKKSLIMVAAANQKRNLLCHSANRNIVINCAIQSLGLIVPNEQSKFSETVISQ